MKASALFPLHPRLAVLLIAAAFLPVIASAQDRPIPLAASTNPAAPANPAAFTYDVVSIKPSKQGGAGTAMQWGPTPDGFSGHSVDLGGLIFSAYPILTSSQIIGLPDWAGSSTGNGDRYDIEAKMDEDTAAALNKLPQDQQDSIHRTILQAALADRFNLKIHKETREQPLYNLVIAKNGPKFKETPAGKDENFNMGWGEISGDGIEIKELLPLLSGYARRFVADKTGLTGKFSWNLKWNPLSDAPAAFSDQYPQFKNRPSIFDALEEQLGLKLEPAKGPVDVYVIDHVEKPSEN